MQELSDSEKARILEWLVSEMQCGGLMMDGTAWWRVPHSLTSRFRSRTALESLVAAYEASKPPVA